MTTATELQRLYSNQINENTFNQNLTFPTDLLSQTDSRNAYTAIRFHKYTRPSIEVPPILTTLGGLRLPLPTGIKESHAVDYTQEDLGPMAGAAAEQVSQNMANPPTSIGDVLSALGRGAAVTAAGGIVQALQSVIDPRIRGAFSSVTGMTVNQFQTVLFKAPRFKSHNLSWKLIPRNAEESELIRRIVELFKFHSSPDITPQNGIFFIYPSIVHIQLFPKEEFLYRFKTCVIESVNVNYAPNGPSLYQGTGAPAAVEISLALKELEYWTKKDFLPSTQIGRTQ